MAQGDNAKKAISDALNGLLADSYALYFKTKNFHWHVKGPHFHDYHLLFDAQATQIQATLDVIAERVRKNGQRTLTSIGSISKHQSIADNDDTDLSAADMLKILRDDNEAMIQRLRDAKELAEKAGDNASNGLIDQWTDEAEERAWFLREAAMKD